MLKIYYKPTCSTCRKTLEILEQHSNEEIEIVEYMKTKPTVSELKEIVELIGIKPEALVRKKEDLYKANYANKQFSDSEWLEILAQHPELIERPIVVKDGKALIGRPPETVHVLWNV